MMNEDIINMLKKENIRHWQLAKQMNIHETTLSRWFREKLSNKQKTEIKLATEAIRLSRKSNA